MKAEAEGRRILATALRILAAEGHGHFAFGHASARSEESSDLILVKKRGSGFEEVDLSSFTRMDLEGNDVDGGRPLGGEMPIHTELYRARSDVRAIVHTHPPAVVTFSLFPDALSFERPYSVDELPFVERGVGYYPTARLVETIEEGRALAAALADRRAAVLASHGLVAVGATVQEATLNAVLLERSLRRRRDVLALGGALGTPPRPIERETALDMIKQMGRMEDRERRMFDYLARAADRMYGELP